MEMSSPYAEYVIAAYGVAFLCLGGLVLWVVRRRRVTGGDAPAPRSGSETAKPHDARPEGSLPRHLMAQSDAAEEREIDA